MAGLQEDNKNLKVSLSKLEAERKQAQERSNNLEKVDPTWPEYVHLWDLLSFCWLLLNW